MLPAGQQLRLIREQLGFTLRDVENASLQIAAKYDSDDYAIPLSRLSDIETKDIVPSIHRLYTLAVIYRCDLLDLLSWYGINVRAMPADFHLAEPPKSHRIEALKVIPKVNVPVALDPGFDIRRTTNLGRMIERWGLIPLSYLEGFATSKYTYGYVGTEDLTMYPLLLPGSFVQIDESRNDIQEGLWRSEYERPIYFVETRKGHFCSWCNRSNGSIVLQPHPLSPEPTRIFRYPTEAEILGQVVGVAMRLDKWRVSVSSPRSREPAKLS